MRREEVRSNLDSLLLEGENQNEDGGENKVYIYIERLVTYDHRWKPAADLLPESLQDGHHLSFSIFFDWLRSISAHRMQVILEERACWRDRKPGVVTVYIKSGSCLRCRKLDTYLDAIGTRRAMDFFVAKPNRRTVESHQIRSVKGKKDKASSLMWGYWDIDRWLPPTARSSWKINPIIKGACGPAFSFDWRYLRKFVVRGQEPQLWRRDVARNSYGRGDGLIEAFQVDGLEPGLESDDASNPKQKGTRWPRK